MSQINNVNYIGLELNLIYPSSSIQIEGFPLKFVNLYSSSKN